MPEYIWNGVGLTTPDGWEPAAIERDGLMLEQAGRPVCEVKWRTIQGTFSFEKHLKRLAKGHKSVEMRGVAEEATPEAWREASARLVESGIRSHSFIWQAPQHRGIGAALHHPGTGLAALIQFFIDDDESEAVAAEVLASFRDYASGKTVPWAMFGLSARVPASFVLDTFSFKPGHYMVKYWRHKSPKQTGKMAPGKGPGTSLVFQRFAPASVLLKGVGLRDWCGETLSDDAGIEAGMVSGSDPVFWAGVTETSLLRKILRRESHSCGQVWTTGSGNAILSVHATGSVPVVYDEFTPIHQSYTLIKE